MKTIIIVLLAAVVSLGVALPGRAQTLTAEWATACGSNGAPSSLAFDGQGNVYVLGSFAGTITIGQTTLSATQTYPGYTQPADYYLAKFNMQGQQEWAIQLGDGQSVQASRVVADNAGNVYMTGGFASYSMQVGAGGPTLYNSSNKAEGFIARFSGQTGQCQWARRFGGTGEDGGDVLAIAASGEIFLAGTTGGGVPDFGPFTLPAAPAYSIRGFLARLSASGTWLQAQPVGNDGQVYMDSILLDGAGSLYLTGIFASPSVTLGTQTLVSSGLSGGTTTFDLLVAKYSVTGALRWVRQGDPTGHNDVGAASLAYDGQGRLFLAGSFNRQFLRLGSFVLPNASSQYPQPVPAPPYPWTDRYYADAYVACLDTAGTWQWATRRGGPDGDGASVVGVNSSGQLLAFTLLAGNSALTMLNTTTGAGGTTYPLPFPVLLGLDQLSRLHCAGSFTGSSLSFGGLSVPGAGSNALTGFVARLGALPLATHPTASANPTLYAWPTPGPGTGVWVQGAKTGQVVEVFDVLGRRVGGGIMPASGPLRLSWAGAGLAPGMYVVRGGGQSCRWVVEN